MRPGTISKLCSCHPTPIPLTTAPSYRVLNGGFLLTAPKEVLVQIFPIAASAAALSGIIDIARLLRRNTCIQRSRCCHGSSRVERGCRGSYTQAGASAPVSGRVARTGVRTDGRGRRCALTSPDITELGSLVWVLIPQISGCRRDCRRRAIEIS